MQDKPKKPQLTSWLSPNIAWVVLVISVIMTVAAWHQVKVFVAERFLDRFNFTASEIKGRIETQLTKQYLILRAGQGFVQASEYVSREEWRTFVSELELPEHYPGIVGFGYSESITGEILAEHVAHQRANETPDYRLKTQGRSDLYYPIFYLEPGSKANENYIGLDLYSDQILREAINRIQKTGDMVISAPSTLSAPLYSKFSHSVVIFLPVAIPPRQGAENTEKIALVFSPVLVADLLRQAVDPFLPDLKMVAYDITDDPQGVYLYSSKTDKDKVFVLSEHLEAHYRFTSDLHMGGRVWRLWIYSDAALSRGFEEQVPDYVAGFGAVVSFLVFIILQTISRQKQRAEVLAEQMSTASVEAATRLQAIFDTVEDAVLTMDEDCLIETANPSVGRIFGGNSTDYRGANIDSLMPPEIAEQHDAFVQRYIQTGEAKIIGKRRVVEGRRSNGSNFPLELYVKEMYISNQRMFLAVMRDLTEQQKVDKLKSEFISTVSHELRTPLTAINGSIALAAAGVAGKLTERGHELLGIAQTNCERLKRLIDDLLDIEKLSAGSLPIKYEELEIDKLLEEAVKSNEAYVKGYNCRLQLENPASGQKIAVDHLRFQQVLSNLISNAAKFSPDNGLIRLRAETLGQHPETQLSEPRVRVSIIDQGPGIKLEFQTKLFERFTQEDSSDTRRVGGSGLGLYITKQLVEKMGGTINFKCPPEGGSIFYLEFSIID